jgi:hypothetical protein
MSSDKLESVRERLARRRAEKRAKDEATSTEEAVKNNEVEERAVTRGAAATATGKTKVKIDALSKAKRAVTSAEEQFHKEKDNGLFKFSDINKVPDDVNPEEFMDKLEVLRMAQLSRTPELPKLCHATIKEMRTHEELVHLLSDEQLSIITGSALMTAKVEIKNSAKSKGLADLKSKAQEVSLDDF